MPYQFRHYDVITTLEQQNESSTYLVSTREQAKQKAILKIFHKPAILNLEKREKFFQQINTLIHIKHPHIVPIIAGDIEKGSAYVVSEYMAGGSLRARLDRSMPERLPFEEALRIVSQVGQALAYLHAQEIVHGHLKPKHIFFDLAEQTFLSDIYQPEPGVFSEQETSLSSLRYLAPEQCQEPSSAQTTTALSDQYALCCVAYELFTGQVPFIATDISELREQQINLAPTPLTSLGASVPASVNAAILKGLEKDPSRRYATITELLTALQTLSQATTHMAIPIVTAGQTSRLLPPNTPKTSDANASTHFTSYDRPTPGTLIQSAQPAHTALWHPLNTATNSRQKKVWLGSAILTILCCLIVYAAFAIYSPPVALTHGEEHTQSASPSTTSTTQAVHTQPTQALIATPTSIVTLHPMPTATARPQSNPTPTPTIAPQRLTPTPLPTVTTAIAPLFTGQLSTQSGQRGTYATNLISQLSVSNVRIEADISSSGNGGGIAFRSNKNFSVLGYRFFIGTNGSYELLTALRVIAIGSSPAIKTGNNIANHITIVAVGSTITIAANAQSIISVSNGDYSSGSVGVMAVDLNDSTVTTCDFSIYAA